MTNLPNMAEEGMGIAINTNNSYKKGIEESLTIDKEVPSELDRIMSISDDPNFQRFVPGYISNKEKKPYVEEPYFHGTGSYALKRILSEGLIPRGKERRFTGEAVALDHTGVKPYISLSTGDDVGELLSTAYGHASGNEESVEFNADKLLPISRRERVVQALGGTQRFVEELVALWLDTTKVNDADEYRRVMQQEMNLLMENALGYGSYVYNQEKTEQNIIQLQEILAGNGGSLEEIRKTMYRNNILKGKLDREIQKELDILKSQKENSSLGKIILSTIDALRTVSQTYSDLPSGEREELENQFPVVLLIDGKGLIIEGSGSLVIQERKCVTNISPGNIPEIRVPQRNVSTVEKWVAEKGLKARVVPLEYTEVKEVVTTKQIREA